MFPPIRTGTSFYTQNIAQGLINEGVEVEVVTIDLKHDYKYSFKIHYLKSLHINIKSFFKHLRFTSFFPSNYFKLNRIIKSYKPDIVLLVNHYLDIAIPTVILSKKNKIPLFVSIGTQLQSFNRLNNSLLKLFDKIICGNFILPFSEKIISWDSEIDRYVKERYSKKVGLKSVIIPFGANGNIEELHDFRPNYSSKNTLLGVGAIISQRNYVRQILTFKKLEKLNPDLKFLIIGHIYINAPKKLVNQLNLTDKIQFLGELPHEEVLNHMKNCDVHWMMLNGDYVGLGTSTIEAMLLGVPCVSNVPANLFGDQNQLLDMRNYIYSDDISVDSLANKIAQVLGNDKLKAEIGINGKNFAYSNLNWTKVSKMYINLFSLHV